MHALQVDRRTSRIHSAIGSQQDAAHIVQHGIQVQALVGTLGAVEFLKMQNIPGAVIHRVLTGESVRTGDHVARGEGANPEVS